MARLRSNIARPARLTAAVDTDDATLPVSTTAGWPDPGPGDEAVGCLSYPDVDRLELFTYTGVTEDSFTGVTRGVDDTIPRSHRVRALVVHVATAAEVGGGVTELAALSDVDVAGATDGQVLTYDLGTDTWVPATASAGAALDDLTDVATAGAAAGDRLVFDGATWEPGPVEYVQFVYNSSGGQDGNRFNDWSDLMARLGDLEGPKLILFEQDETIPAGAWNLDNTELRGNGIEYNVGGYTLTFGDATTISSWANMKVHSLRLLSTSTTGSIFDITGAFAISLTTLAHVHSTSEPFFSHSGAGQLVIGLQQSARWRLLAGGVENLTTASPAFNQLVISRGANSVVDDDTLASINPIVFIDVCGDATNDLSGSFPSTHTNLSVGFGLGLRLPAALAIGFDPTGLATVTADNVQDAIAQLDAAAATSGTYTPTATPSTTNCDAVTPGLAFWTRIGDIVSVSGFVAVDHTAAATATVVLLSLPIASDLADFSDLAGTCSTYDAAGSVTGEDTNDLARFDFTAPSTATRFYGYNYAYRVL